ncbi:MAG: DUF1385 domain-containing protein [Clostridia bacterium]|nr:DUF1385 domain-containing protein [Clostridia bacterium]
MKDKKSTACPAGRLGRVGGQSVLEGIMMKCGDRIALAVREENGNIKLETDTHVSIRKKHKILSIPLVRGVANFVESMMLSYKTLMRSAYMLGIDDTEEDSKFEAWLRAKLGSKFLEILTGISMVLGVILAMALFLYLPAIATTGLEKLLRHLGVLESLGWFRNLIEGLLKIGIFVAYISLCSLMKEMRRTFEYHGAEHKTIACYEAGMELTPENAMKCTRFHPRCGTSFIFVILILSILINSLVPWGNLAFRALYKLLLLPVVVGLGFEFIAYAGKHTNIFTRILSAPGLWMQRITTREPDEGQLEVAILALKHAMPEEFPEIAEAAPESNEAADTPETTDDAQNA